MINIKMGRIVVNAMPGAGVDKAIKEAIRLALDVWADVTLVHNDREYVIDVEDIFNAVACQHE